MATFPRPIMAQGEQPVVRFMGPAQTEFESLQIQAVYFLDEFWLNWKNYKNPKSYIIPPVFKFKNQALSDAALEEFQQRPEVAYQRNQQIIKDRRSDEAEFKIYDAIQQLITDEIQAPFIAFHGLDVGRVNPLLRRIFPQIRNDLQCEFDYILIGPKIGMTVVEVKSSAFTAANNFVHGQRYLPDGYKKGFEQLANADKLVDMLGQCTGLQIQQEVRKILFTPNLTKARYNVWRKSLSQQSKRLLKTSIGNVEQWFQEDMKNVLPRRRDNRMDEQENDEANNTSDSDSEEARREEEEEEEEGFTNKLLIKETDSIDTSSNSDDDDDREQEEESTYEDDAEPEEQETGTGKPLLYSKLKEFLESCAPTDKVIYEAYSAILAAIASTSVLSTNNAVELNKFYFAAYINAIDFSDIIVNQDYLRDSKSKRSASASGLKKAPKLPPLSKRTKKKIDEEPYLTTEIRLKTKDIDHDDSTEECEVQEVPENIDSSSIPKMYFLSLDQNAALNGPDRQFLIGVAGVGKTVVLLTKAIQLLSKRPPNSVVVLATASYMNKYQNVFASYGFSKYKVLNLITISMAFFDKLLTGRLENLSRDTFVRKIRDYIDQEYGNNYAHLLNDYEWLINHDSIIVDDALDDYANYSYLYQVNLFSYFLMTLVSRRFPEKLIWVAMDPYFVPYRRYVAGEFNVVDYLVNDIEARDDRYNIAILKQVMRCSGNIFRAVYGVNDELPSKVRPVLGHKTQGPKFEYIPRRRGESQFNRAEEALTALMKTVIEIITDILNQNTDLSKVAIIISGGDTTHVYNSLRDKIKEILPQHLRQNAPWKIKSVEMEMEWMEQNKNILSIETWDSVSSLEWPIVVHASLLRENEIYFTKYFRYRAMSRATAQLIDITYTYQYGAFEHEKGWTHEDSSLLIDAYKPFAKIVSPWKRSSVANEERRGAWQKLYYEFNSQIIDYRRSEQAIMDQIETLYDLAQKYAYKIDVIASDSEFSFLPICLAPYILEIFEIEQPGYFSQGDDQNSTNNVGDVIATSSGSSTNNQGSDQIILDNLYNQVQAYGEALLAYRENRGPKPVDPPPNVLKFFNLNQQHVANVKTAAEQAEEDSKATVMDRITTESTAANDKKPAQIHEDPAEANILDTKKKHKDKREKKESEGTQKCCSIQ